MKKALIIIVCGIAVLGGVAWGTYELLDPGQVTVDSNGESSSTVGASKVSGKDKETEQKELEEQREKIAGSITDEDLAAFKEQGLNPFGEQTKMNELSDTRYQEYIHGMSHQKVKASKKWGFYEIHPERIQWLLSGLEKVELAHEETYRGILEKWHEGNFASADDDHNAIWNLQGGTVGRATGVMSPEEEQNYIDSKAN